MFRQIIGIPMGTNCAPLLANIFLHMFEKMFITDILMVNTDIASYSKFIFRFQDDLIVFEDNGVFDNVSADIYPPEMIIQNTNLSRNDVNYLDLNIKVCNETGKYVYKSYDKRRDFKLSSNKLPKYVR